MPEENKFPIILHLFKDELLTQPPYIDDILDNFDQDVWNQIAELSKKSPYFKDLTDKLLRRTKDLPKEEKIDYINEAHSFCTILAGYEEAEYFIRNFFEYLFDKTREMEDTPRRSYVYIAKAVYNSAVFVLEDKIGQEDENTESLYAFVNPRKSFTEDLGFNKNDYDLLKKDLIDYRAIEEEVLDNNEFYRIKTVAELIEFIAARQDSV